MGWSELSFPWPRKPSSPRPRIRIDVDEGVGDEHGGRFTKTGESKLSANASTGMLLRGVRDFPERWSALLGTGVREFPESASGSQSTISSSPRSDASSSFLPNSFAWSPYRSRSPKVLRYTGDEPVTRDVCPHCVRPPGLVPRHASPLIIDMLIGCLHRGAPSLAIQHSLWFRGCWLRPSGLQDTGEQSPAPSFYVSQSFISNTGRTLWGRASSCPV